MRVLSEKELAESERSLGTNVIQHDGTYWKEVKRMFYMPVNPLKVLITSPKFSLKLPFRMFLCKENANTIYTLMEIDDPAAFDLISLTSNTRSKVRRGLKRVRIEEIFYKENLCKEAFEVYKSFYDRTGWGNKSKLEYKCFSEWFKKLFESGRLTLGGFVNNKLAGFLRGYVVDNTACLSFIATHSDYLTSYPNEALIWNFIEKVKAFPDIHRIVYSTKSSKHSLNTFKVNMGFLEKIYPARVEGPLPPLTSILAKIIANRF